MSAPGQDAPPPAAENGSEAQQGTPDPWESAFSAIPEATRQFAEEAFNPLREQFTPRLELADRLEPLGDYADDLLSLVQDADDDGNSLQDLLGFAQMLSQIDPDNLDADGSKQFVEWWENVGEQLGLLGDDEEDGEEDLDGEQPSEIEQRLARLEQENAALREEHNSSKAESRVANVQQVMAAAMDKGIAENKIEDNEENRKRITALASAYANDSDLTDAQVIERGIADYLTLTGQGQRELLGDTEIERVPAGSSPGGGAPDASPEDILTGNPSESRKRAHQIAMQRLRAAAQG